MTTKRFTYKRKFDIELGVGQVLLDNGKEMCVAADIVFIPISVIYLFNSNHYNNHSQDRLLLSIILLINVFFTIYINNPFKY